MLVCSGSPIHAGSALLMQDGSSVLIAPQFGPLQLWARGEAKPRWKLNIGGDGPGVRSRVAAMAQRRNGDILVVERLGDILTISPQGRELSRHTPFYEYVRLRVEYGKMNPSKWDKQIDFVAQTAAAAITDDADHLYLVPDMWSTVRKVAVDDLLRQPNGTVRLTEWLKFQFKDGALVLNSKIGPVGFDTGKGWTVGERKDATALAVCDGWIIAGTRDGSVVFIPESGDATKDQRMRQVGNPENQHRSILDASCLGPDFAYTVSFEAGNGQIQLWNMKNKTLSSSIDGSSDGHPGMAYTAVRSKSGTELLSLGDGDLRIWSVANGKLSLVAKHYIEGLSREQVFAAVPLDSGGFVFWDGSHVMKATDDGSNPILYAGPKIK